MKMKSFERRVAAGEFGSVLATQWTIPPEAGGFATTLPDLSVAPAIAQAWKHSDCSRFRFPVRHRLFLRGFTGME
jgi:hypothetical protein